MGPMRLLALCGLALLPAGFVAGSLSLEAHEIATLQVNEIRLESVTGWQEPNFSLTIHNDGTVDYVGRNLGRRSPRVVGRRHSKVSPGNFNKLVQKAEEI